LVDEHWSKASVLVSQTIPIVVSAGTHTEADTHTDRHAHRSTGRL